jgi:signal transduction histidine kinase
LSFDPNHPDFKDLINEYSLENILITTTKRLNSYREQLKNVVEDYQQNALKNAEESDKLKSSFLSNMSHEIRTPLNAVIGFSELLEDENLTKETTRKYVKHIKENGSALLTLIADILELSRIESGVFSIQEEPLNLNELFKEFYPNFLQLSYQKGKKHLRIISNIPSNDVIIQSDKQRIRQIMINLFDNALKFTGEGSIEFGFKIIYDSDNKSMIEIMMKDTGIGIPILKQHLLFKRFIKIHESSGMVYPGAGLGLSIVNQIVTRMGGNIKNLRREKTKTNFDHASL